MTRAEYLLGMVEDYNNPQKMRRMSPEEQRRMLKQLNQQDDARYTDRESKKDRPSDDWLRGNAKRDFWSKEKDIRGREYKGGSRR
jgi:hypothetical protein